MVPLGDIGGEIEAWDVPAWQKRAIFLANKDIKPDTVVRKRLKVWWTTRKQLVLKLVMCLMTLLMVPMRFMISGEASVGNYPIQAVQVMGEIVRCAQNQKNPSDHGAIAEDVCMAVHTFAERFEKSTRTEKSIILVGSGFVARSLAKYRLVFASHACLFRRGTRTV